MDKLGKKGMDRSSGYIGIISAYETSPFCMTRLHMQAAGMDDKKEIPLGYSFDESDVDIVDDTQVLSIVPEEPTTINFLDEVEDIVTGFKGKVASKLVYANGCVRWVVHPPYKGEKDYDKYQILANKRLKIIRANKEPVNSPKTGGPIERSYPR